ncbi:MAG: VOC family protein [Acidimicrobiia bacterium]|nr:VOC family protein [Acidimicrobiia bacterium]
MLDTVDLETTTVFWSALLGLDVIHRDQRYVYLAKPGEGGLHLAFQLVPEEKVTKNRMHLDIEVPDREAFAERLVAMGGSVITENQEGELPVWNVMADPLGNEFCIYSRKNA